MHAISETPSVTSSPDTVISGPKLSKIITQSLEDHKAEDVVVIDLKGKTSIADLMIIANGRSQRQVSALADYIVKAIKEHGLKGFTVQGQDQADWVLIDAEDVIVHIFRPEVRSFYNLDKMWGADLASDDNAQPSDTVN